MEELDVFGDMVPVWERTLVALQIVFDINARYSGVISVLLLY